MKILCQKHQEATLKAREYAISKGLAKAGKGKLSKAAHEAIQLAILEGKEFEDYKDGRVVKNGATTNSFVSDKPSVSHNSRTPDTPTDSRESGSEEPIAIKSRPVTHEYSTIYGVDVRGRSPLVIAFQYCSMCIVQVRYCSHKTPELPAWIGGGPGFTEYPSQEKIDMVYKIAHSSD